MTLNVTADARDTALPERAKREPDMVKPQKTMQIQPDNCSERSIVPS